MRAVPYTTKTGARQFRPRLSEREWNQDDGAGFCLACGSDAEGVEPDARQYPCAACGARKVYGLEQLAIMGLLVIDGEE